MTHVRRPALRYHGAKWRLAPWIIRHLPQHVCYVEPFGGAMGVLLRKPPSHLDVYNDLDGEVVNFFLYLRDRPADLIRAIELTPFSRAELDHAQGPTQGLGELERARRFYVRAWQAIGGPRTRWRPGWRFQKNEAHGKGNISDWTDTGRLYAVAQRLRTIYFENDEALPIIARYDAPTTLFYCDPPYPGRTRSEGWRATYAHEMDDDAHAQLAHSLQAIQGMAIISSYPSSLYDDLYAGWQVHTTSARTNTYRTGAGKATECIWISPNAARRGQLTFALTGLTPRLMPL